MDELRVRVVARTKAAEEWGHVALPKDTLTEFSLLDKSMYIPTARGRNMLLYTAVADTTVVLNVERSNSKYPVMWVSLTIGTLAVLRKRLTWD